DEGTRMLAHRINPRGCRIERLRAMTTEPKNEDAVCQAIIAMLQAQSGDTLTVVVSINRSVVSWGSGVVESMGTVGNGAALVARFPTWMSDLQTTRTALVSERRPDETCVCVRARGERGLEQTFFVGTVGRSHAAGR